MTQPSENPVWPMPRVSEELYMDTREFLPKDRELAIRMIAHKLYHMKLIKKKRHILDQIDNLLDIIERS